jgi:hypothetical protein
MEVVEMRTFSALRGVAVALCVAMSLVMVMASGAFASGTKLCISEKEGGSVKTPKGGVCPKKYKLTELGEPSVLSKTEQEELKELRKYVKVIPSGIDGKPTVQVSGANVQIINGEGNTATSNGEGNLVIGYDELGRCAVPFYKIQAECEAELFAWEATPQTGSHNLVLGAHQTFTSYGGILTGAFNTISAPFASVTGGDGGTASGEYASVSGGFANTASKPYASVTGGGSNEASGDDSSVNGGSLNKATGPTSSVSGGEFNKAGGNGTSVSGGYGNETSSNYSSVGGGQVNKATGEHSWVSGGYKNKAGFLNSSIAGGIERETQASGESQL